MVRLSVGLLAGLLAILAVWGPTDLVLLNDYLDHPYTFAVAATVLVGAALFAWLKPTWLRVIIVIFCTLVVAAVASVGMVMGIFDDSEDAGTIKGPGSLEITVRRGMAGFGPDSLWELTIRTGPLGRGWNLGCFNDDAPGEGYADARWVGPHSIEMRDDDGQVYPVALDPESGEPQITAPVGTC